MQLRPATISDLQELEQTREAYREMWSKLRAVPARAFDGGPDDLDALSFIDYEAGYHPGGTRGAALLFGGVLVQTGVFDWAMSDDGYLVLLTRLEYPRVMIFPYARLAELQNSSWPSPSTSSRFTWLLEEIIVRLHVGGIDGDDLRPLLDLTKLNDPTETLYWDAARISLNELSVGRPLRGR